MKTVLKIPAFFVLFVLVMSITVNGKHLFSYVYDVISPATTYAQAKTMSLFGSSMASTQVYAKKLFNNSIPEVRKSAEAYQKRQAEQGKVLEELTEEDKQQLTSLIKSH